MSIVDEYIAGNWDFQYADLRDANLRDADLRGADLRDANLRDADLRGANLSDADLSDADLRGANLTGADLRGADLFSANLSGANLTGADLRGADLFSANLRGADLRGANLTGADLRGADLFSANLAGCMGIYSARAPFMSGRNDGLYAGAFERDGALVLLFTAGCKTMKTAAELRALVAETHGDTAHGVQYRAAIAFIEACYESDLASGRFEVQAQEGAA